MRECGLILRMASVTMNYRVFSMIAVSERKGRGSLAVERNEDIVRMATGR
jgi:hypothetical protein